MTQERDQAYSPLHASMAAESDRLRLSARRTLAFLNRYVEFADVLDVGCGIGIWLVEAMERGCRDAVGVDGPWLDRGKLLVPSECVRQTDLEAPIDLGRRFDLVMSLEVAEHLSPAAAATFVQSLTAHGDVVLFSAAVPEQDGAHHVNEQWPSYWQQLFKAQGFDCFDVLRPNLWNETDIGCWYRQNMLLFARPEAAARSPELARWRVDGAVQALVHPDLFVPSRKRLADLERVMAFMAQEGDYRVGRDDQGRTTVRRI